MNQPVSCRTKVLHPACYFFFALLFVACAKEETPEEPAPASYAEGTFVVNEGTYANSNASISWISPEGTVQSDPYFSVNGVGLGDILQSVTIHGNRGFAVVNNSQKVEVFSTTSFAHMATITGCDYPRYLHVADNGKAYLTNGAMAGSVKVVDLDSYTITSSIAVGNGPEAIVRSGDHLYVANSGGWVTDNTVSVIDLAAETVVETVTVGDRPADLVVDASGDVWVLCSGETQYDENWNIIGHTDARLVRIDAVTHAVTFSEVVGVNGDHPRLLEISPDGQTIYYVNNNVHTVSVASPSLPGAVLVNGQAYGLSVDPSSGEVWMAQPTDFFTNSTLYRFTPQGAMLETYTTGLATNAVVFP